MNPSVFVKKLKGRIFSSLYLLVALVLLSGHDLYIKMETYFLQPDQEATLSLYNGTFENSENLITRDRMLDASVITHGERVAINPNQWQDQDSTITQLTFTAGKAGTYVAGVSTKARNIELTAEKFNRYLEHDGVLDMLEYRTSNKLLDQNAVESYQKHVKAIYQVGDVKTDDWSTILGYPIEFVPQANPYTTYSGEKLEVQLLLDGKPLPNQLVYANHIQQTHSHTHEHDGETHSHEHAHDDGEHAHDQNSQVEDTHSHTHEHDGETHSHEHAHDDGDHSHTHNSQGENTHSHTHEHDGETHSHEHAHDDGQHAHAHNSQGENTHSHTHEHDGETHSHEHAHDDKEHAHAHNSQAGETHSHTHEHDGEAHSHEHAHDDGQHAHAHKSREEETHTHTTGQQLRTNDKGIVTVDLPHDGIYYLRTIHMVAVEDDEALTHQSKWATLTFEVSHQHGSDTHTHDDHEHEGGIPTWGFILGSLLIVGVLFLIFRNRS
ncbi:MAG: DUF4198 domain-containing protein [Bacteroidota bacterium]